MKELGEVVRVLAKDGVLGLEVGLSGVSEVFEVGRGGLVELRGEGGGGEGFWRKGRELRFRVGKEEWEGWTVGPFEIWRGPL